MGDGIRPGLKYTDTHEWVKLLGDTAKVGITDHAQSELTDIVFVELPEIGKEVEKGDELCVVESVSQFLNYMHQFLEKLQMSTDYLKKARKLLMEVHTMKDG